MNKTEDIYKLFQAHPVICTDTRLLTEGCLFFALKGENFNGNEFADKALNDGAAYAIIDELEFVVNERSILVNDVLTTLQQLAAHHRQQLNIPVLAITGSNGKTTTKELTAAVLSKKYNTLFTKGNLNNHIGVPLTLLSLTSAHEIAVIEMGANHQKEIEQLCKIAQPDYGLITNIGKAHLEGFGGLEGVKKGKGELYQYIKSINGLIFINEDNATLRELLADYTRKIIYGSNQQLDLVGEALVKNSLLSVQCTKPFSMVINTNLTGDYNFENVMSAITIGNYFKVDSDKIKEAIENYFPSNQRSQIISKSNNVTIVMDAYNANPSSVNAALENFSKSFSGDKIIALGDMLELGNESEAEHLSVINNLHKKNFTKVVLVGPQFKIFEKQSGFQHFNASTEAAEWFKKNQYNNCYILIKGSRGLKMEVIADIF